jgi:flagellar basal-body rod modification protein FlgD
MSIADIVNGTAGAGSNAAVRKLDAEKDQLGRDDFLKLMLAQLKNQDPMKAMDPSEFLGQLAQFSTVSGIQAMQDSIGTLSESMRSAQVLDGSTMIGRDVLVPSEDASLGSSGSIRGAVEIPTGAVSAQMNIRNSAGALVRSMPVTATAGLQDFTWDGITSAGERAESGAYSFEVVANVGGENESLQTLLADRVNSVTIDAKKGLTLNTTALGPRALSDVRRVM